MDDQKIIIDKYILSVLLKTEGDEEKTDVNFIDYSARVLTISDAVLLSELKKVDNSPEFSEKIEQLISGEIKIEQLTEAEQKLMDKVDLDEVDKRTARLVGKLNQSMFETVNPSQEQIDKINEYNSKQNEQAIIETAQSIQVVEELIKLKKENKSVGEILDVEDESINTEVETEPVVVEPVVAEPIVVEAQPVEVAKPTEVPVTPVEATIPVEPAKVDPVVPSGDAAVVANPALVDELLSDIPTPKQENDVQVQPETQKAVPPVSEQPVNPVPPQVPQQPPKAPQVPTQ